MSVEPPWTWGVRAATVASWPNRLVASRASGVPAPATLSCRNGPGPVTMVNTPATVRM